MLLQAPRRRDSFLQVLSLGGHGGGGGGGGANDGAPDRPVFFVLRLPKAKVGGGSGWQTVSECRQGEGRASGYILVVSPGDVLIASPFLPEVGLVLAVAGV